MKDLKYNLSLVKGLVSNLFSKIAMALYSVLSVPVLFSALGSNDYGIFLVTMQSFAFIYLLEIGLVSGLGRSLAKSRGQGNFFQFNLFTATTFWMLVFISVCGAICLVAVIELGYFSKILPNISKFSSGQQFFYFCLMILLCSVPLRVGRGIMEAKFEFFYIDAISIFSRIVCLGSLMALFYLGVLDLIFAISISVLLSVLPELFCFLTVIKLGAGNIISLKSFRKKLVFKQLDIGLASFFTTLAAMISRQGYIIFFAIAAGTEFTHLVAIPVLIVLTLSPLVGKVSAIYLPIMSQLLGAGKHVQAVKELHKGLFISSIFTIVVAGSFLFLGQDIVILWLSKSMPAEDINIIFIGASIMIAFSLTSRIFLVFRSYAQASNFHRNVTMVSLLSAIWSLAASFFVISLNLESYLSVWKFFLTIFVIRIVIFDVIIMTLVSILKCKIRLEIQKLRDLSLVVIFGIFVFLCQFIIVQYTPEIFIFKFIMCIVSCGVFLYMCAKFRVIFPKKI